MMKKLGLTSIVASALLFTGCGGGGSGSSAEKTVTEQIAERDGVVIIHGSNLAFCETVKEVLSQDSTVKDVISDTPANTVNCSTYNKVEGDLDDANAECINTSLEYFAEGNGGDISIYEDPATACVIGANEA